MDQENKINDIEDLSKLNVKKEILIILESKISIGAYSLPIIKFLFPLYKFFVIKKGEI
ncbi:hypothetical protein [Mycoplasmopsis caviae]|nr:hypothetical protein [Mycoplasmopsis caviae]